MISLFNLGILLTRKCNQQCYYCNNFNINSNSIEIDIEYLKWILSLYTEYIPNLHVELSGGEPGIISNIEDVFETLMTNEYVKKITVLSNGMIRKLGYNLKDVFQTKFGAYYEHFCLEIRDKDILFFYPELPFYDSIKDWIEFILVLSDTTLNSLLDNFEYFKKIYHLPITWKSITPKIYYPTSEHFNKLNIFYKKLLSYNSKAIVDLPKLNCQKKYKDKKLYRICSKISIFQFIDIENKQLGLCSMQVQQSTKFDITKDNIYKAIIGTLFKYNDFCQTCYKINLKCLYHKLQRKMYNKYDNISIY